MELRSLSLLAIVVLTWTATATDTCESSAGCDTPSASLLQAKQSGMIKAVEVTDTSEASKAVNVSQTDLAGAADQKVELAQYEEITQPSEDHTEDGEDGKNTEEGEQSDDRAEVLTARSNGFQLDKQSQAASDLGILEEACKKPKPTDAIKWNAMKAMAVALNSLDAPYSIHGGAVLGLVRGCYIFDKDIDFVVERSWLKSNVEEAVSTILAGGFSPDTTFGQPDKVGFERSFRSLLQADARRSNLKAAFETSLATNGSTIHLLNREGIKVDLFTIERESDRYEWGLWIKGQRCPCDTKSTGTVDFLWLGVNIKVPVPLEDVLTSLYGAEYMTPRTWMWNVEPFTIGSCRRDVHGKCGFS